MPVFYHGSIVGGLTKLMPFSSPAANIPDAAVYLSASKALSSIYIWNREYKWMTFHIGKDDIPVYTETHKGALHEFYNGVKGYIYACEGEYAVGSATGIKLAAVSYEPVIVSMCEPVENAYEKILSFETLSQLVIRRYEDLSIREHTSNRNMILGCIERLDLLNEKHPLSAFVKKRFPNLWEDAKCIDKTINI